MQAQVRNVIAVRIMIMDGTTIELQGYQWNTVFDLKTAVFREHGIPIMEQDLFSEDVMLKDTIDLQEVSKVYAGSESSIVLYLVRSDPYPGMILLSLVSVVSLPEVYIRYMKRNLMTVMHPILQKFGPCRTFMPGQHDANRTEALLIVTYEQKQQAALAVHELDGYAFARHRLEDHHLGYAVKYALIRHTLEAHHLGYAVKYECAPESLAQAALEAV